MIRRAFFDLLLFLLPFALYAGYVYFAPKPAEGEAARPTPWTILCASGLVLVALSFVWLGIAGGAGENGTYIAPHVVDGKVVPGHIERQ